MPLRSRFFKHIITLLTGSAGAQAITFLFFILLARVYLPVHFGYLAIFFATVTILGEVVNGRYDLSILLPAKDDVALNLLRLCLLIAYTVTAASVLVLVPVFLAFNYYQVDGALQNYFLFLPLSVLVQGVLQPLTYYLNRTQKYTAISMFRFIQATVTGGLSLVFGIAGFLEYGLLIGLLGGQFVALLFLLLLLKKEAGNIFFHYPISQIKEHAKEYSQFPRYSVASSLLNSAGRQSPFYLLAIFFGADITGHFSLAFKLITAPVLLVSGAYGQVFYERAVKLENKMRAAFRTFIVKNIRNLFLIGVMPILITLIWGQQLVVFLLGETWNEAGLFLQYLSPLALMLFIINPLVFVLNIRNKLHAELVYNAFLFTGRIVVLVAGGLYLSSGSTILSYTALGVLFNLFLLMYIFSVSSNNGKVGVLS